MPSWTQSPPPPPSAHLSSQCTYLPKAFLSLEQHVSFPYASHTRLWYHPLLHLVLLFPVFSLDISKSIISPISLPIKHCISAYCFCQSFLYPAFCLCSIKRPSLKVSNFSLQRGHWRNSPLNTQRIKSEGKILISWQQSSEELTGCIKNSLRHLNKYCSSIITYECSCGESLDLT